MRQVKFRYWNGNKVLNQEAIINHLNKYIARNDKHLMQFTGLLDKQGVEIYEGDIVDVTTNRELEWSLKNGYAGIVEYDNAKINIGVNGHEYSQFICGFICKSLKDYNSMTEYCTGEMYQSGCKVIGNIYENPELLESK